MAYRAQVGLIVVRDEPGSGFTDSNVVGNAVTMVFAGEDTTSNTIAWLLHFLARDEQVAACITAEADMVLAGRPIANEFRQLDQLIYIEAATKEAMRLKPVAVILALETNIDTPIRDALIPAGTIIICVMRNSAQRDTSVGNPDEFMPERWLSAEQSASMDDPARKMCPFGGENCIRTPA
jgi:cytochrome P450